MVIQELARIAFANGTDFAKIVSREAPTAIIDEEGNPQQVMSVVQTVPLLEYLVKTYTNEGDTVLDNCMGSGSTGVACLRAGRHFIGIEKDPQYFQVAKERLEKERTHTADPVAGGNA